MGIGGGGRIAPPADGVRMAAAISGTCLASVHAVTLGPNTSVRSPFISAGIIRTSCPKSIGPTCSLPRARYHNPAAIHLLRLEVRLYSRREGEAPAEPFSKK